MILSDKEKTAFTAIVYEGMGNICTTSPASLLVDNCSWFMPSDIMKRTKFNFNEVGGLLSSLEKKGIIANSGDGDDYRAEWYISEIGIEYAIENTKTLVSRGW